MSVISLAAERDKREPHWAGEAVCLGCRHEWVGVGPMERTVGLECPECALPKGVVKHLFGAAPGDLAFTCLCGCEAMTVYQRQGHFYTRCMACGTDQTNAIYGT